MFNQQFLRIGVFLRRLDLISLLLIISIVFPLSYNGHYLPIRSFYNEWSALFLGLAAAALVGNRCAKEQCKPPLATLIPLCLLPSAIFHLWQREALTLTAPIGYLIAIATAAIFMSLGQIVARRPAEARWQPAWPIVDTLAFALLLNALIAAWAACHWRAGGHWVDLPNAEIAAGLIGQRNHNGLFIYAGLFGLCHFYIQGRLRTSFFLLATALLAEAAIASQSRSVFLYALGGIALGFGQAFRAPPQSESRRRWLLCTTIPPLCLGLLLLGRMWLLDFGNSAGQLISTGALARYAPSVVAQDGRHGLWWVAAQVIREHPLWGVGPGGYLHENLWRSVAAPIGLLIEIPASHCHNLFLQIAAELGTPTALMLAGLLGYSIWRVWRYGNASWTWISLAVPMAILLHNQVEYSLWYLHVLIPFALCMGVDSPRLPLSISGKVMLSTALMGLLLTAQWGQDYQALRALLAKPSAATRDDFRDAAAHPFWGPFASAAIASDELATLNFSNSEQYAHAARAMESPPFYRTSVFKYIEGIEHNGQAESAAHWRNIATRIYGHRTEKVSAPRSATN